MSVRGRWISGDDPSDCSGCARKYAGAHTDRLALVELYPGASRPGGIHSIRLCESCLGEMIGQLEWLQEEEIARYEGVQAEAFDAGGKLDEARIGELWPDGMEDSHEPDE